MVSVDQAQRWLRLADRNDGAGRRARARLERALDHHRPAAFTAVDLAWRRWLTDPVDSDLRVLRSLRRPASTTLPEHGPSLLALGLPVTADEVLGALRRTGHPLAGMARDLLTTSDGRDLLTQLCRRAPTDPDVAELCVRYRLVPADPAQRAVFLLLTGQLVEYRRLDPGLEVLIEGVSGLDARHRRLLLDQVRDLDDPRPVRALARPRPDPAPWYVQPAKEVDALAGELIRHRAWPELWAMVRDLRLVDAVPRVRLFEGWRPAGAADRDLFDRLAQLDPDRVARARATLRSLARISRPLRQIPHPVYEHRQTVRGAWFTDPHAAAAHVAVYLKAPYPPGRDEMWVVRMVPTPARTVRFPGLGAAAEFDNAGKLSTWRDDATGEPVELPPHTSVPRRPWRSPDDAYRVGENGGTVVVDDVELCRVRDAIDLPLPAVTAEHRTILTRAVPHLMQRTDDRSARLLPTWLHACSLARASASPSLR